MNENIQALLNKLSEDGDLLAKFSACESLDEAYELVSGCVSGISKEEFGEAVSKILQAGEAELSDEELAGISGGGLFKKIGKLIGKTVSDSAKFVIRTGETVAEKTVENAVESVKIIHEWANN